MPDFDRDKTKALLHHVCSRCRDESSLGAVKLRKILWFADITAFRAWGTPITGDTYIKLDYGPVPRHANELLKELAQEGKVADHIVNFYGFSKHEYVSLQPADVEPFSVQEIALVDEVIDLVCDHTAKSISDVSHDDIWKIAKIGEEIPFEATLVADLGEVDEDDVKWALKELRKTAA